MFRELEHRISRNGCSVHTNCCRCRKNGSFMTCRWWWWWCRWCYHGDRITTNNITISTKSRTRTIRTWSNRCCGTLILIRLIINNVNTFAQSSLRSTQSSYCLSTILMRFVVCFFYLCFPMINQRTAVLYVTIVPLLMDGSKNRQKDSCNGRQVANYRNSRSRFFKTSSTIASS